jgi:hypothetical protein
LLCAPPWTFVTMSSCYAGNWNWTCREPIDSSRRGVMGDENA